MITTHLKLRGDDDGFGFNLRSARPCRLDIIAGGLAETMGLEDGDALVALDGAHLERADHLKVANRLRKALKKREIMLTVKRGEPGTAEYFTATGAAASHQIGMPATGPSAGDGKFTAPLKNANVGVQHRYALRSKFATLRPSPGPKSHAGDGRISPVLRRMRRKSAGPARQAKEVGGDESGDRSGFDARKLSGAWNVTLAGEVRVGVEITSGNRLGLTSIIDKVLERRLIGVVELSYLTAASALIGELRTPSGAVSKVSLRHSPEGPINRPPISINAASIVDFARSRINAAAFGVLCRWRASTHDATTSTHVGGTLYLIEIGRGEVATSREDILESLHFIASSPASAETTHEECESLRAYPGGIIPPTFRMCHPPVATSSPYPPHFSKGRLGRASRYVNEPCGATPPHNMGLKNEEVDDECCTLIDYSNSTTSIDSTSSVEAAVGADRGIGGKSSSVANTRGGRTSQQRTSLSSGLPSGSAAVADKAPCSHSHHGSHVVRRSPTTVDYSSSSGYKSSSGRAIETEATGKQLVRGARPTPSSSPLIVKRPSAKVEKASTPASSSSTYTFSSDPHHRRIADSYNSNKENQFHPPRAPPPTVGQGRRRRRGPSPPHSASPSPSEDQGRKASATGEATASAPRRSSCVYDVVVEADRPPRPPSLKKLLASAQTSSNNNNDSEPHLIMPGTSGAGSEGGGAIVAAHHNKAPEEKGADIERILKSESARAPFHQFLQQQFCAENINFYLAVEEYRTIPDNEVDRRVDFGRQIYDRHFAANCAEPVNIDNSTANGIREAYRMNRFTPDLYDLVQYQIFHLLKYDCWPRYLRANGGTVEELGGDSSHRGQSIASSSTGTKAVEQLRQFQCSAVTDRRDNDPYRDGDDNDDDDGDGDSSRSSRSASSTSRESLVDEPSSSSWRPPPPLQTPRSAPRRVGISRRKSFFRFIHRKVLHRDGEEPTASGDLGSTEVLMGPPVPLGEPSPIGKRTRRQRCSVGNLLSVQQQPRPIAETTKPLQPRRFRSLNRRTASGFKIMPPSGVQSTTDYHMAQRSQADFPAKYCTLLYGDSTNSMEIAITDQLQSVRQWTATASEICGADGNASEVVDAQSGCTIDPARQAVDALNSRTVRIMPVVKFPVVFLASSGSSQQSKQPPLPAKVVILRSRLALTVGKVLRPIMVKYNVDPDQAVVCVAGSCDVVKMPTPISTIYQKTLTVLSTHQQFAERKLLAKKETQKELTLVPAWMTSNSCNPEHQLPFHQHGDVAFCEVSIDQGGGLLNLSNMKYSATRSYSSNPREFFKFGRKASHAKNLRGEGGDGSGGDEGGSPASVGGPATAGPHHGGGGLTSSFTSHLRHGSKAGGALLIRGGSDRRKSLGAQTGGAPASPSTSTASTSAPTTTSAAAGAARGSMAAGGISPLAVGLVAPSDIPYCGEDSETPGVRTHAALYPTKSAIPSTSSGCAYEMPDFLKQASSSEGGPGSSAGAVSSDDRGLPPIYASSIRSDKETALTPSETIESGLAWQKADYV